MREDAHRLFTSRRHKDPHWVDQHLIKEKHTTMFFLVILTPCDSNIQADASYLQTSWETSEVWKPGHWVSVKSHTVISEISEVGTSLVPGLWALPG